MSVFLLDTDTLSLLFRGIDAESPLHRRFREVGPEARVVSVVTYGG